MQYWYPLIAYLLGSIPFGLILSNLFGKGNLRESGSKNIGTTNVMRTQGKLLGALTFLLDFGKGAAAAANLLNPEAIVFGGGVADSFDLFAEGLEEKFKSDIMTFANKNVRILKTELG